MTHGLNHVNKHMATSGTEHIDTQKLLPMCRLAGKTVGMVEGHVPQGVRVQVPLSAP